MYVVLIVVPLALPWLWLVRREIDRLEDPSYLRRNGVVIVLERALEAHGDALGRYMGSPIWRSVTFMGMVYRFDRVALPSEKERLGGGELYLDPGIVYVTD